MPNVETPLTRAATQVSQEIIPVLRNTLVGRRLAAINPFIKGDGKTATEYTSISDISDGFVQWNLPTGTEFGDSIVSKLKIINIPVLYKKFDVRKSDVLAWENRLVGQNPENNLNLLSATAAARKVAEQEENLIFDGWRPDGTNYAIKGLTQAAANVITGGAITITGTMFGYVCDAISALEDDVVFGDNGAYNLAITPAIKAALLSKRYQNGDRELAQIKEILNGGDIYTTPYIPAGVALVTPVDNSRQHFEFLNPVDYRVEFAEPKFQNLSNIEGISYELFTPVYMREHANGTTDAIAKITGLTA